MGEAHPHRPAAWGIAIVATLGMSVSYIDRQTLAAIAPSVRKALDLDHKHYGALISAFSIAYLLGAPLAGVAVDRLGARRGFALAVLAWTLVAGMHALASSFAILFLLRILLGAAESPSFPAAVQTMRRALPGARRPLAYGLLFTGSSIGAMIAAKLAIHLEAGFGFRFAFLGTALVGSLWLPLWLLVTRGAGLDRSAPPDAGPRVSWREVATSAPVLRAMVAVVGSAPAIMFLMNWCSQYLVESWHLDKSAIGNYLVVPPLFFDLGAVGFGFLASRWGRGATRVLLLASMALAATLALAPLAPSPGVAIAIFAASICGGGGIYVLVTADMLDRVPAGQVSSAGGMTAAAQSLAHILASPLIGAAIDRSHSFSGVLVALGIAVLPTSLVFLLWPVRATA